MVPQNPRGLFHRVWLVLAALCLIGGHAPRNFGAEEADEDLIDGKTVKQWIELFAHEDDETRDEALDAVLQAGPDAVGDIVAASSRYGDRLFVAKFTEFTDQEWNLLDTLDEAIYELGEEVTPDLAALLSDKSPHVRAAAAAYLSTLGPEARAALPELRKALTDRNEHVRDMAASALGEIGSAALEAKPELVKLLTDSSAMVRISAALALRLMDDDARSIPILVKHLEDRNDFTRAYAANAIGSLGKEAAAEALPALKRHLNEKHPHVRYAMAAAVWDLEEGDTALPVLIETLSAKEAFLRESAAAMLGEMETRAKSAIPALRILVEKDKSRRVRSTARKAIESIKSAPPLESPVT
jgi:RNAse (barnase) inhibitor barstar